MISYIKKPNSRYSGKRATVLFIFCLSLLSWKETKPTHHYITQNVAFDQLVQLPHAFSIGNDRSRNSIFSRAH